MKEKKVFVIFGRNTGARDMLYAFLRAIGLEPIEWNSALTLSGSGSPFIGNIVDKTFENAQALIVLMTGDEVVRLKRCYDSNSQFEFQSRPNVIFEAGMAFGKDEKRTIIVQIGTHREISDLSGRHIVFWDNSIEKRLELIQKLKIAGCEFDLYGKTQWSNPDKFNFSEGIENINSIPKELVIENFYETRSQGQNFETILSMCKKDLVIIGVKFGSIMQQLDLVVDKLQKQKDFKVKFFLLSPIDCFGNELPWIDQVEKINCSGNLLEILKLNIINLRRFKKSIKSNSVRKRIIIKFYYIFPTASMVFYDRDDIDGMVRIEPFMYRMMPMQRSSFDVKKNKSTKLYEKYSKIIDLIENDCSISLESRLFDNYLKNN